MNRERLADYRRWHRLQVASGDIDPAYPVLRILGDALGPEEAGWLVLRHVAYYHLGSALRSYCESPGAALPDRLLKLRTGTERRAHRDVRQFRRHWDDLAVTIDRYGGVVSWLTPTAVGVEGWRELSDRITAVRGNGRWAAYKLAELAQKVLGAKIDAPDAGHADSTGPRKGLALLRPIPSGNSPKEIALLNRITTVLAQHVGEADVAQVETSLCDFHSGFHGRYYIGRDIDEQQEHLIAMPSDLTPAAYAARAASFPLRFLGEVNGWNGVDKPRCRVYRDRGEIVER